MNLENLILQSDASQLYSDIKRESIIERRLPINIRDLLIGFGKFDNFYMFWITRNGNNGFSFNYRIKYIEDRSKLNKECLSLTEENREKIFECIQNIFTSFCDSHPGYIFEPVLDVDSMPFSPMEVSLENSDEISFNKNHTVYEELEEKLEASLSNLHSVLEKTLNQPIAMELLDTRTKNVLRANQITDYHSLSECSAKEIILWKDCGRKTIRNIIKLMDEFGCEPNVDMNRHAMNICKQQYYTITRVKELLQNRYYTEYKLSEEDMDKFGQYAALIVENFKSYIQATLEKRSASILCDYIFDDSMTLKLVGKKYNITREGVRQIVLRYRKKLKRAFSDSKVLSYTAPIMDTFSNVSDTAFVHFIAFAFLSQFGKRVTSVILQCLLNEEVAEEVIATAKDLIYKNKPLNKNSENNQTALPKNDEADDVKETDKYSGDGGMFGLALQLRNYAKAKGKEEGVVFWKVLRRKVIEKLCKTMPQNLDELATVYGVGKRIINNYGNDIIEIIKQYVQENNEIRKESIPTASTPVKKGNYEYVCDENGEILTDLELLEELRKLRLSFAKSENVAAFCIFLNSHLVSLATYKPTNKEEWLAIKGLSKVKYEEYGEPFIELIKKYSYI